MNVLEALLSNGVLAWGLAACGIAQLSKLIIELVVHRRWNPKVLVETGGMPSSHSALLTARQLGWAGNWVLTIPSLPWPPSCVLWCSTTPVGCGERPA